MILHRQIKVHANIPLSLIYLRVSFKPPWHISCIYNLCRIKMHFVNGIGFQYEICQQTKAAQVEWNHDYYDKFVWRSFHHSFTETFSEFCIVIIFSWFMQWIGFIVQPQTSHFFVKKTKKNKDLILCQLKNLKKARISFYKL